MNARLCPLLLLSASACATANAANTPPQHAAAKATAQAPRFEVDGSLVELAATCRPAELPQANALDDDCDGAVDGQPATGATVTLAFPRAAALRIVLQGPDGVRTVDASCPEAASVCTARVTAEALPSGRHELRVESVASADARPTSVAVSKSGEGEVRTYLAELTQPGETRALGTLVRE